MSDSIAELTGSIQALVDAPEWRRHHNVRDSEP